MREFFSRAVEEYISTGVIRRVTNTYCVHRIPNSVVAGFTTTITITIRPSKTIARYVLRTPLAAAVFFCLFSVVCFAGAFSRLSATRFFLSFYVSGVQVADDRRPVYPIMFAYRVTRARAQVNYVSTETLQAAFRRPRVYGGGGHKTIPSYRNDGGARTEYK